MAIFLLLPDSVRMQTDSLTLPNSAGHTVGLDTFGFGQAPLKWEFDEWARTKPFFEDTVDGRNPAPISIGSSAHC